MHAGFGRVSRADVVQGDEPPAFAQALGAFDVVAGAHEVLAKSAANARPPKLWRLEDGVFLRVDAVAPVLEDDSVYVLDAGDARKKAPDPYSGAGRGAGRGVWDMAGARARDARSRCAERAEPLKIPQGAREIERQKESVCARGEGQEAHGSKNHSSLLNLRHDIKVCI